MGYKFTMVSSLVLCSSLMLLYWIYWRRKKGPPRKASINTVIFFPDKTTAKLLSSSKRNQPSNQSLEESSLSLLMEAVQNAQYSLDVCMFTMACRELSGVLIKAHEEGAVVRVITDKEQIGMSGSQIEALRRAGIQVRNDNTSYFMHHKFVLVDGEVLINGSLNWTLQGVCGNQENVLITNNTGLVQPFVRQFEHLWALYDPGELT